MKTFYVNLALLAAVWTTCAMAQTTVINGAGGGGAPSGAAGGSLRGTYPNPGISGLSTANALNCSATSTTLKECVSGGAMAAVFANGGNNNNDWWNLSQTANDGDPLRPNPVMNWGYNLAAGAGLATAGDTALGIGLEGNYIPAGYQTGTVTATNGSATVTGSGTTWTSALNGQTFSVNGRTQVYAFTRVSNTSGTISPVYGEATIAGAAYDIGLTFNEAHLYFVDSAGAQWRPWSWRIDKVTNDWQNLIHANSVQFFGAAGVGGNYTYNYTSLSPSTFQFYPSGLSGASGLQITGAAGQIQFSNAGTAANLAFAGWSGYDIGPMHVYTNGIVAAASFQATGGVLATTGYFVGAGATVGVTCSGTPTASFASTLGIVTHC